MKRRFIGILAFILALAAVCLSGAVRMMQNQALLSDMTASAGQDGDDEKFAQIRQIYDSLMNNYYQELDSTALIEGAIDGMLAVTGDPYTFYYTVDEWTKTMQDDDGKYAGIGIQVLEGESQDSLLITRSFADSPAYRAGVKAGDRIVAVDGYPLARVLGGTETYALATAAPDEQSNAEERAWPTNSSELVDYMRGAEGTSITLTILRGDEYIDVTLVREVINVNRVEYCLLDGGDGMPKVGYMVIYEFQGDAADGVKRAVDYFNENGAQALIVDVRNNPGGNLDVVTSIVETLLPKGLYAYIEDRHGNRQEFYSDESCWGKPMAVLVNGYSASASELLTGAAQDMGAALIVGENTFGKGIVQSVQPLSDGSCYQMTTARYFTPSGRVIQGNGIAPDIEVKLDDEVDQTTLGSMIAENNLDWKNYDSQLLAAYEAVEKRIADGWTIENATAVTADQAKMDEAETDDKAAYARQLPVNSL